MHRAFTFTLTFLIRDPNEHFLFYRIPRIECRFLIWKTKQEHHSTLAIELYILDGYYHMKFVVIGTHVFYFSSMFWSFQFVSVSVFDLFFVLLFILLFTNPCHCPLFIYVEYGFVTLYIGTLENIIIVIYQSRILSV